MSEEIETAACYRARALEPWTIADSAAQGDSRLALAGLGELYERLAVSIEDITRSKHALWRATAIIEWDAIAGRRSTQTQS